MSEKLNINKKVTAGGGRLSGFIKKFMNKIPKNIFGLFFIFSLVIFSFLFFSKNAFAVTDVAPHNMTSNALPIPYVASASTEFDATYRAFNVFDGINSTYWVSTAVPAQIKLDLGSGNGSIVKSYAIKAGNLTTQHPKNFTFEGSNDNSTWNIIDTVINQTGWTASEVRMFNCDVFANYRYYRVNVSANVTATVYVRISEIYMYLDPITTYTMTGPSGGTNGVVSQNFSIKPDVPFTGTITPNDSSNGGTFNPTSLTWSEAQDTKTFTYTPASIGAKTISTTNDGGLTNSTLTYYSTTPYTVLPSDLWENVYSTNLTNYYLSSEFSRLKVQTDARGLKFTVWKTRFSSDVAVVVDGVATIFTATLDGDNTFTLDGLASGQKTIEIVSSVQYKGTPQTGAFIKSVEWFGANTTIIPPDTNKRIVFYGDSIISGVGTSDPPTQSVGILVRNHYINRSLMFEAWASRSLKDDSVMSPISVNQSLIDNLTLGNPTHIWLAIGVNDYGPWSADNFGIAYGDLIDRLHSALPHTKIIAQTQIPQATETANGFGNTLGDYRNKIITLSETRPWITLVNGPSLLTYPTDYSDTQHPSNSGSIKYANATFTYLNLSTDATLSNLTTSSGTLEPMFDSGNTSYSFDVANSVDNITITPVVNQDNATVKVNDVVVATSSQSEPISLDLGLNTINIEVTAQDGITINTYTVIVNRTTPPETPIATPIAGLYNSTQSVSLSSSGSDYIKYDLSSLPSDCSSGTLYGGTISVAISQTIYVRACDNAGNSSTQSFAYTIDSEAPSTAIAIPSANTYTSNQSVSLTSVGSDSIRYSTIETPADCSAGTLYENPIQVSTSQTIHVRACDSLNNSSTISFVYVISPVHRSSGSSVLSRFNNLVAMGNLQASEELKKEFPSQIPNQIISPSLSTPIAITKILKLTKSLIKNEEVETLQTYLNTKGYNSGIPDGRFGPKTKKAVIKFQLANKLKGDGIVGPKTKEMMK